jgi:hypothetical protein
MLILVAYLCSGWARGTCPPWTREDDSGGSAAALLGCVIIGVFEGAELDSEARQDSVVLIYMGLHFSSFMLVSAKKGIDLHLACFSLLVHRRSTHVAKLGTCRLPGQGN